MKITIERCVVCNSTYEDFVDHTEPRIGNEETICPVCTERINESIEFMIERDEVNGGLEMSNEFKQMSVEDWEKRLLNPDDGNVRAILRSCLRRSFNGYNLATWELNLIEAATKTGRL